MSRLATAPNGVRAWGLGARRVLAKVFSCAVIGVLVEVEVDVGAGQPGMVLVGLPDAAVQESRERVRAAIRNSGGRFPHGRVTVNLAPAYLKKAGPTYDMPIAIGILLASQAVLAPLDDALLVGEMSLVSVAAERGMKRAFVPAVDAQEAALVAGITVYPVRNLSELVQHLNGFATIEPVETVRSIANLNGRQPVVDFADIQGQEHVKRGMEVAAAISLTITLTKPSRASAPSAAGGRLERSLSTFVVTEGLGPLKRT